MVNNAQQRVASPNFGGTSSNDNNRLNSTSNSNTNNSNAQYKANITSFMPEMGRRFERMSSAPTLPMTPKSCLRRKSCLHKSSTESIEVTDKDTNTDTKCSENNG